MLAQASPVAEAVILGGLTGKHGRRFVREFDILFLAVKSQQDRAIPLAVDAFLHDIDGLLVFAGRKNGQAPPGCIHEQVRHDPGLHSMSGCSIRRAAPFNDSTQPTPQRAISQTFLRHLAELLQLRLQTTAVGGSLSRNDHGPVVCRSHFDSSEPEQGFRDKPPGESPRANPSPAGSTRADRSAFRAPDAPRRTDSIPDPRRGASPRRAWRPGRPSPSS